MSLTPPSVRKREDEAIAQLRCELEDRKIRRAAPGQARLSALDFAIGVMRLPRLRAMRRRSTLLKTQPRPYDVVTLTLREG